MSETGQARAARWRNIVLGGASAGVARATAVICSLVQVPLALRFLGVEGFGLWVTLQATVAFLAMLDFGLGYRLQNHVAQSAATSRLGEIRHAVRAVLLLTAGLGALLAVIALAAGPVFWSTLLGVDDPRLRAATAPHLGWLVALGCGTLPANIGMRLASGLQKNWLVGASQALVGLVNLAIVAACAIAGSPAVLLLAGTLAVPLVANTILTVLLLGRLPPALSAQPEPSPIARWVREGLPFFVPQLSASLRVNLPPFIIAALLGAAAVTPYNLIQRLLNFIAQPQVWLLDPLWAAYTDAVSRADYAWIKRALRFSLAGSAVFTLLPVLSALWWGPGFLQWWTGYPAAMLPAGLLLWLVVWQAGLVLTQPFSYCLNGLGRMRGQLFYGTLSVALSLVAMALACPRYGLGLAVAPAALIMLLFNLPCAYLDVCQVARRWSESGNSLA